MATLDDATPTSRNGRAPFWNSYARLSRVPETDELEKIEIQHEDNAAAIRRRGAVVGEPWMTGFSRGRKASAARGWESS